MKNILSLTVVLCCMLYSCSSPEKDAKKIVDKFQTSLEQIVSDASNLNAYELSKQIETSKATFDLEVSNASEKIEDSEKRDIFDDIVEIDNIEIYQKLLQELTNKNLAALKDIQDKKWINKATGNFESIFIVSSQNISFANLNKTFDYSIVDGNIVFDEECGISPIFFILKDGVVLTLRNSKDETVEYREAKFEDMVQGKWRNSNFYDDGVIFKSEGKGSYYGDAAKNITYTLGTNRINVFIPASKFFGSDTRNYSYNPSTDKITLDHGARYNRVQDKGPDCLTFLFDGNKENADSEKPKVSYSSSESSGDSNNNWDKIIDEYEVLLDQYLVAAKKAKAGDVSMMTDVASILEKADKLQRKLEKAEDDLTTSQATRFSKIVTKFATTAAQL